MFVHHVNRIYLVMLRVEMMVQLGAEHNQHSIGVLIKGLKSSHILTGPK